MRNRIVRSLLLSAFVSAALCAASPAFADTNLVLKGHGMDARLFRPAVDTKGHFTVDATPVMPHLSFSIGLILDFGFNQWVAVEQDDDNPDAYDNTELKRYFTAQLLFNLGLFNRFVVGFQIPVMIPSGTMFFSDEDQQRKWTSKGAFGDISIHTKFFITRANVHPVGLGFLIQYQAPSGKSELLVGEPGGGAIGGKMIIDVQPGSRYRAGLNIGGRYSFGARKENLLNWDGPALNLFRAGPVFTASLGQSITLYPKRLDLVIEAYAASVASEFGNKAYTSLEANAGIKIYIQELSFLMMGYAHGIPLGATESGYGVLNVEHRAFIGFVFEPSIRDKDGDGLDDAADACPEEPEDFDNFEDSDGCPDPDNDKDGIPDKEDDCPLAPEDRDGDQDEDGCPENAPEPERKPVQSSLDSGDNDRDRIVNKLDDCPNDPETYNGNNDQDGCPDEGDVVMTETDIKILKKVYFEYDSDKIKEESFAILDAVAATIIASPQINFIEAQGHADERGNDRYNLNLTTRRAAAVKRYLVDKGVESDRLQSMGYGEYCPVRLGHTEEDWDENRRVEFKILKVDGTPTGVQTGCPVAEKKGVVSPPVR